MHINIDFVENIEKRDDFNAIIEREISFAQNICFRDVAKIVKIDYFKIINEMSKNEFLTIVFKCSINDANIDIDSFVDVNVANDVKIAINVILKNLFKINFANFVFDIKKKVDKDANIAFDVDIAILFANFVNFL